MVASRVECRSDHDYIGRPLAFYWLDERLEVTRLLSESRTPQGYVFRLQAANQGIYELIYDPITDQWSVSQL
jgi:hypothetical protein